MTALSNSRDCECIVIGSGAGGLAAAATLSRGGAEVLVLEAMTDFGGYLNPFRRKAYSFNTGMHYLGQLSETGVFRALLERMDVWDRIVFNQIDSDGFIRFICGDLELALPAGRAAISDRLSQRFPKEAVHIDSFLDTIIRIDQAIEAAAEMDSGVGAWFRALTQAPFLLSVLGKTYLELVSKFTSNPELRGILCMMNSGLPAKRAAAIIPALMFNHYLDGAYYPRGGSGAIRDALVSMIRKSGNRLQNHTRVVGLHKEKKWFVVRGEEGEWRAPSLICNTDPTTLYGTLLEPSLVPERLRRRVRGIVPSYGAFYAYVVTDLNMESLGIGSATVQHWDSVDVILGEDWNHWDQFKHFLLSCTTLKDVGSGHAPPGQHILELVAPAPFEPFSSWARLPSMRRGKDYMRYKTELGWRLIKKAESYIPGLASNILYVDFATPITNSYWVNTPEGGCYGPMHLPSQVGRRRFAIQSPIPGLFLCGHGTLAGGIYSSMRSGELAARAVLSYLGF